MLDGKVLQQVHDLGPVAGRQTVLERHLRPGVGTQQGVQSADPPGLRQALFEFRCDTQFAADPLVGFPAQRLQELAQLFLERHAAQQVDHARFDSAIGPTIDRHLGLRHGLGH